GKTIDSLNYEVSFIGGFPENKQIYHPRVSYKGLITEIDVLKREFVMADILVCPSYAEGMPTVILEAMASGCAIIATDVGAINTMVDYQNGWLIEGDIKIGLEQGILEALQLDWEELQKKKLISIDRVADKYTWDHVIKQTINTIRNIKIKTI
ncbi:MAG: glycosyltransferase, partial [Ferruginibacter sp.]